MPYLKLQDIDFYYVAVGNRDNHPLLLLHGFIGSHRDFEAILPILSEHFYCIVPDLPGHGRTIAQNSSYSYKWMTQSISDFVEVLGIQETYLLGYSLGGRLALYFACWFPGRYTRTILESASPGLKTKDEQWKRQVKDQQISHRLKTTPFPDFLSEWYTNPLFSSLRRYPKTYTEMCQRRLDNSMLNLSDVLVGCGLGRQPSWWERLTELDDAPLNKTNSIRLFVGELDTKFVKINREMLSCCPKAASLRIFEDCGHNVHLEAPDEYALAVLDYLTETS